MKKISWWKEGEETKIVISVFTDQAKIKKLKLAHAKETWEKSPPKDKFKKVDRVK